MLVYLDNSQFAWLERAASSDRDAFVKEWQELGCELALSLQLLQEIHKRGDDESVKERVQTLLSLEPLRGMPAGSAGVMVREVADQIRGILHGTNNHDAIAAGRAGLFPPLTASTVFETLQESSAELGRFNAIGQTQAVLQANSRELPMVKKGTRVDPRAMEAFVRAKQQELLAGLPQSLASDLFEALGDRTVDAIKATGGDLWQANLQRLGIAELECIDELHAEDYSKTSGFVEMARDFSSDVAALAGTVPKTVLDVANQLRPYDAPGYSLEMAVSRARVRHSRNPKASDLVDEEHVVFTPYVDVIFVDKRTKAYLEEEVRRGDGRINYDPSGKLARASNLDGVLEVLRVRASNA